MPGELRKLEGPGTKALLRTWMAAAPYLHLYKLGDLDDRFFPKTEWFAQIEEEGIQALLTVYSGLATPCVLATTHLEPRQLITLLEELRDQLPSFFHVLGSHEVANWFEESFDVTTHLIDLRMGLLHFEPYPIPDGFTSRILTTDDAATAVEFYQRVYPTDFFDKSLLATGTYIGAFQNNRMVSVAGIHTFAPEEGVAGLGNIATDPDHRRLGLGRAVTSEVCALLRRTCPTIGLNVRLGNEAAISTYKSLGFEVIANIHELHVSNPNPA